MFKDDYKRDMDGIKPSASADYRIKSILESPVKRAKNPAMPWRIGFALAATAAIVLTVAFGNFVKSPEIEISDKKSVLLNNSSYSDIFSRLDALRDSEETVYDYAPETVNGFSGKPAAAGARDESSKTYSDDSSTAQSNTKTDYSTTTAQVEGVDESDIVKTDGKYIYVLSDNTVRIVVPNGGNPRLVSTINLPSSDDAEGHRYYHDMYLHKDRLTVIGSYYGNFGPGYDDGWISTKDLVAGKTETELLFYDVSEPQKAELVGRVSQCGDYNSSRMIDGTVYVISNHSVWLGIMDKSKPETYVPTVSRGEKISVMESDCIMCPTDSIKTASYLVLCSYQTETADFVSALSVLGSAETVYSSTNNLIAANADRNTDGRTTYTVLHRFSLNGGNISYEISGSVRGTLINQFAIDEHEGYFRMVTTTLSHEIVEKDEDTESGTVTKKIVSESTSAYNPASSESTSSKNSYTAYESVTSNGLYVLDKDFNTVGAVDGLAENEQIYSVRFMGDIAYFVTFKEVDPLFSVDISDPANPKVIGELKIPGFSEYLYPYGDGMLLGIGQEVKENSLRTAGVKLSMFDISDPANVAEKDKTVISGSNYSEALDNHKACIVNSNKNLIGFAVTGKSDSFGDVYVVYSYSDGGFTELARIECDDFMSKRGLFIGDEFYIAGYDSVKAFAIDGFKPLGTLEF